MDLRGHGLTFGKRGHCAPRKAVLEDIDTLIEFAMEKFPGKPIVLYGHSMGGNITMDYRKRGNKNSMIAGFLISAPWVQLVRQVSGLLYVTVTNLAKIMPQMTISSGVSEKELGNKKSIGEYNANPLVHKRVSLETAVDGFTTGELMAKGELEDNGGAKGIPMLLMHGDADKICDVKGSRKVAAVEDCEYVEWPGLFHEIHNGGEDSTGDEVIEKMIQWIKAV
jgi:alpha-beta hydrolase superfamily lysophospholipase